MVPESEIEFTVWGEPVPQGRARFARRGNFVTTYDPEKSRNYKHDVKLAAIQVKPETPLEGPISLTVKVFRSIPKSFGKKKVAQALAGELRPITKPDLKNIITGIEDALKGIIWKDDSQVVDFGKSSKWYSENPRVEVVIKERAANK